MDKAEYWLVALVCLLFLPLAWVLTGDILKGLSASATVYMTYIFYSMVWDKDHDI